MKFNRFISVLLVLVLMIQPVCASGISHEAISKEVMADISVTARSAVLYCCDNSEIVYEHQKDLRLPMASTTKIMTALVAIENSELSDYVNVAKEACGVEGSSVYLYENERLTIEDLLYAVLLESANDAAAALAIEVGGNVESFVDMMNRKAVELGMNNTAYKNPHGLDEEGHYSTALDLAILMTHAMTNEVFADISGCYRHTAKMTDRDATRVFINHNRLLNSCEGVCGGKTGYTKKSGRCLVSYAVRDGISMCAVTLNDGNDWRDHSALYDAGFLLYQRIEYPSKEFTLPAVGSETDCFEAEARNTAFVVKRSCVDKIVETVEHERFYYSNVKEGDNVGRVIYSLDGNALHSVDIIAKQTLVPIKHKGFLEKLLSIFIKD